MAFSMSEQCAKAEPHEIAAIAYFVQHHKCKDVRKDPRFQGLGFDVLLMGKADPWRRSVEFKYDERAAETNNLFIETWSDFNRCVVGWARSSLAQYLVDLVPTKKEGASFLPGHYRAYLLCMIQLSEHLAEYLRDPRLAEVPVPNIEKGREWTTKGIPVPISRLRHDGVIRRVFRLDCNAPGLFDESGIGT